MSAGPARGLALQPGGSPATVMLKLQTSGSWGQQDPYFK